MGKVIYRLPSKGTQYGYAEYEFDYDGNPYDLGREYRAFVSEFVKGEAAEQAVEKDTKIFAHKKYFESGQTVTKEDVRNAVVEAEYNQAPTQEQAIAMLEDGLGATVYDEPVEENAPEWEAPPPAPSDDDWDF